MSLYVISALGPMGAAPDVQVEVSTTARELLIAEGWIAPEPDVELEEEWETGQPNGVGTIEPSDFLEWYTEARVTHKRLVRSLVGPWVPA